MLSPPLSNVSKWPFDPANERYVSLATHRRNGESVCTPVWIARCSDRYYSFSERKAGKVKRIRANHNVRIAACDFRGRINGDWLAAHARLVDDPGLIQSAYHALRQKYGWQMMITDFFSKLAGRYQKRVVIELTIEN